MAVGNAVEKLRENVKDRINNATAEMSNVLVIGLTGSGKSSLINSIEQSVVGKPANLARVGRGVGENVTLCIEGCDMFSTLGDNLRDKVKFWDFVGLPNRDDEAIRTLISLALDGRIPENQPLTNPEYFEMCKEELEDEFPVIPDGPKIQRVVVVCAADEEIPTNLLKATKKAAQPATTAADRNIPLFLFISKVDKMVGEANAEGLSRRIHKARDTLDATNYFFEKATLYHEQTNAVNDPGMASNDSTDESLLRFLFNILNPTLRLVYAKPRPEPILGDLRRANRRKYIRTKRWVRKNLCPLWIAEAILLGLVAIVIAIVYLNRK
ncbi:PREDICTED: uncharacterized protein LOC109479871 [Branchiostoma belcheri]|uniref:Uncharacterized protein LOC109479871 n=1 Tax=Branchiostoma belcheri TaxID=7741 RepID=A0A6P4ZL14_BRABE|nr:PREDICTED: uncharacterized protein LOC109479871 [Branchiostoma belcheri]